MKANGIDIASIVAACVPIVIAIIGIVPTIIANRRKTEDSINTLRTELRNDSDITDKKVDAVSEQLSAHIVEDEDNKARQARYRILRFYDEICEHKKHSESHFEDILEDIDFYQNYSDTHPEFKNNRGHVAMEHIKEKYAKVKREGGFLTHIDN